jgi:glutamate dehydrogenase/leucine dehydrogenase
MVICDIDSKKVAAVKDMHTVESVMPKDVYDFDCDIFCPCALEGISTTTRFPA